MSKLEEFFLLPEVDPPVEKTEGMPDDVLLEIVNSTLM
jgi:hypothetical protein